MKLDHTHQADIFKINQKTSSAMTKSNTRNILIGIGIGVKSCNSVDPIYTYFLYGNLDFLAL